MKQFILNFFSALRRYRVSSALNILGLAVAFASFYVIMVQVNYEFSFNQSIKDSDRIYRVEHFENGYSAYLPRTFSERTLANLPGVEGYGTATTSWGNSVMMITSQGAQNEGREQMLNQGRIESSAMQILGYEIVEGSYEDLIPENTVAVTLKASENYNIKIGDIIYPFGNKNENARNRVAAIVELRGSNNDWGDIEYISQLRDDFLENDSEWGFYYYVKLQEGVSVGDMQKSIQGAFVDYLKERLKNVSQARIDEAVSQASIRLMPLEDSYFGKNYSEYNSFKTGNITITYSLIAVALLVVSIALINFVNFFFALVPVRIKTVNTQKIFGCPASKLRLSFVVEALGLVTMSLLISILLVRFFEKSSLMSNLSTTLDPLDNINIVLLTIVVAVVTALSGSIYPAYYITSFPTAELLKGNFSASKAGQRLRYTLITVQFVISMTLLVISTFISLQYSYMLGVDMGFNRSNMVSVHLPRSIVESVTTREAFVEELKKSGLVEAATFGDGRFIQTQRMGWGRNLPDGTQISIQVYPVSYDFIKFMGIEIVDGRDFLPSDELKENGTIILNEVASKSYNLNLESQFGGHNGLTDIVGICEDFNFKPMNFSSEPFAFYVFGTKPWRMPSYCYIRLAKGVSIQEAEALVDRTIQSFWSIARDDMFTLVPFEEELSELYVKDEKLNSLILLFTVISIIISLMGVFGLVLFETQFRRKEIALRRVHGASIASILAIFNSYFARLVMVSFLIALPLSYYIVQRWLESYAYKVSVYWWVFVVALLVVLLITVVVVTVRSLNAARTNPTQVIK